MILGSWVCWASRLFGAGLLLFLCLCAYKRIIIKVLTLFANPGPGWEPREKSEGPLAHPALLSVGPWPLVWHSWGIAQVLGVTSGTQTHKSWCCNLETPSHFPELPCSHLWNRYHTKFMASARTEWDHTVCIVIELTVISPVTIRSACMCMHAKSLLWCPTLYDPTDCSPPGSSVHGNSQGKNTGVCCHDLLQGIFLTQGSNLRLLGLSYVSSLAGEFFTTSATWEAPAVPPFLLSTFQ